MFSVKKQTPTGRGESEGKKRRNIGKQQERERTQLKAMHLCLFMVFLIP